MNPNEKTEAEKELDRIGGEPLTGSPHEGEEPDEAEAEA